LLEKVKSDSSTYVRRSVGNWINDESKHKTDWVLKLCRQWTKKSNSEETKWIVNHGLRTLKKSGEINYRQ
jgi:3-methyladenine DNA glycosylase AlkC